MLHPIHARCKNGVRVKGWGLGRWFNGYFYRLTCRSDCDLDRDAHCWFRLSPRAWGLLTKLLRSKYLVPKSLSGIPSEPVILDSASPFHFNIVLALEKCMQVAHVVLAISDRNPIFHEMIPDLPSRQTFGMGGQDQPDCFRWTDGCGRRRRLAFQGLKSIADHFPRLNFSFNPNPLAIQLNDLVPCFRELFSPAHDLFGGYHCAIKCAIQFG